MNIKCIPGVLKMFWGKIKLSNLQYTDYEKDSLAPSGAETPKNVHCCKDLVDCGKTL